VTQNLMFHKKILMQLKNLELSLEKVKQMLQDKMTEEQNLNESKF
jgi:DNA-binding transcriptional MerR regulator